MDLLPAPPVTGDLDAVLSALRAAGESTRLRILSVLDEGELTVSELCRVLGQSQPRVSRHLRLLCEAGLLDRQSEGTNAYYRHVRREPGNTMLSTVLALLDPTDPAVEADRQRLATIRAERADAASHYFEQVAERWDSVRSLHVDDTEVESALLTTATIGTGDEPKGRLLDIGTGTGRMLELFADRIERGLGIDLSSNMLKVARANLSEQGLHHCSVRQANIYALDVPAGTVDLAIAHHVLHFLDDPAAAVAEVALTLRPGGQLIVVDFAPHQLANLVTEQAHRRLGFDDGEIEAWFDRAGLAGFEIHHLVPSQAGPGAGDDLLTTGLWSARKPGHPTTTTTPSTDPDATDPFSQEG
ncbi:MAG: metalloregulator ArsR/SmtB family transcription factor [Actinomycetota bacterium]